MKKMKIYESLTKMESISKKIIWFGCLCSCLVYVISIIYLLIKPLYFDLTTTLYWAEQLWLLAKEILGATVVPALLFEIILCLTVRKRNKQ